jgi:hypothetical protein
MKRIVRLRLLLGHVLFHGMESRLQAAIYTRDTDIHTSDVFTAEKGNG